MRIHGRVIVSALILIAVSLALPHEGAGQSPPKPPELKVLERYIGTWKYEFVSKAAEWNPKEFRYSGTTTNTWILDGHFQQHKSKHDTGEEGVDILTYDVRTKTYRMWSFDSAGFSNEFTGVWDENSKTLTSKCDIGDGIVIVLTMRFIDQDHRELKSVAKDGNGKVYIDIQGKLTRQNAKA